MTRLRAGLILALSLLALGACDGGRGLYYAVTHRIVRVPTENMLPTVRPGDGAAVDEDYYSARPVGRFHMVTFELPAENLPAEMAGPVGNTVYLRRVIGLGGETLEIRGGKVFINGQELKEPFTSVPLTARDNFGPVEITEGESFLMGDNRQNSLDGRYWARPTLRKQHILGKVVKTFPQ